MRDIGDLSLGKTPTKNSLMWPIGCHVIPMIAFIWNLITRRRQFGNEASPPVIRKLSHSSLFPFKFIPTMWGKALSFKEWQFLFLRTWVTFDFIYGDILKVQNSRNFQVRVRYSQSTIWQYILLTPTWSYCSLFFVTDCYTALLWLLKCFALVV